LLLKPEGELHYVPEWFKFKCNDLDIPGKGERFHVCEHVCGVGEVVGV
jgi:hypothetical protein